MTRRGQRRRSRRRDDSTAMPKELRPLVGGLVLVATVRTIDALWRRLTGRQTPVDPTSAVEDARAAGGTDDPSVVRDRMLYAALLSGALRLARRAGLPKEPKRGPQDKGGDGTSPA